MPFMSTMSRQQFSMVNCGPDSVVTALFLVIMSMITYESLLYIEKLKSPPLCFQPGYVWHNEGVWR